MLNILDISYQSAASSTISHQHNTKRKAIEEQSNNVDGRPVKKPKATTAGRGVEGESSAIINGRTDNSQSVSRMKLPPNSSWVEPRCNQLFQIWRHVMLLMAQG